MSRNGCWDTERDQWLLFIAEGYRKIAVHRLFMNEHERVLHQGPSYENGTKYINHKSHVHRGRNGCSRISSNVRNEIHELLENDPRISLRELVSKKGVADATVWNIVSKELRFFPYKLQMSTALRENRVRSRLQFSRYCHRQLKNNHNYLGRIVFSEECEFSLSGLVTKQNCRIWETAPEWGVWGAPQLPICCGLVFHIYKWSSIALLYREWESHWQYVLKNATLLLFPRLQGYPEEVIFQFDGAPPHYSVEVIEYLDRKLLNR